MPNHVCNQLSMIGIGKKKELMQVDKNNQISEGDLDLDKIVKMPEELDMPSGMEGFSILAYLYKIMPQVNYELKFTEGSIVAPDKSERLERYIENTGKTMDQLAEEGKRYVDNIYNYGAPSWYWWHIQNWGTKWNTYDGYIVNDDIIRFYTAWDPPIAAILALSKMYPYDEIDLKFISEDVSYCGEIKFLDGAIIEENMYEYMSPQSMQTCVELEDYNYALYDEDGNYCSKAFITKAFGYIEDKEND